MKDGPSYACDKKFGMGILCIAISYFQQQNPTTHQSQQRMLNTAQSLHHIMEDPHWTGKEEIVDRWPNLH